MAIRDREEDKKLEKLAARYFWRSLGTIVPICAVSIFGMFGIAYILDSQRYTQEKKREETIQGYPLSVMLDSGSAGLDKSELVTILRDSQGHIHKYRGRGENYIRKFNALEAAALIQSEIDDNDNEPVELTGIYRDNEFEIWSVSANGHTVGRK